MGFNRRKMKDQRRDAAEKEAASRRATDAQVLEDAERLIVAWNERQAKRMPMLFSPTIGAAITAGYWFLWVRCPACRRSGEPPYSSVVVPIMPAERTVCRACAALTYKHRRRDARRTSSSRAGRMNQRGGKWRAGINQR